MIDFERVFDENQKFCLKKVKYETVPIENVTDLNLNCYDDIQAAFTDDGEIEVVFTRKIDFSPASIFQIEVSFGELLTPKESVDIDLEELKKEMIEKGEGGIGNLISRASMMISQLTSTCGQTPIVTPPSFVPD